MSNSGKVGFRFDVDDEDDDDDDDDVDSDISVLKVCSPFLVGEVEGVRCLEADSSLRTVPDFCPDGFLFWSPSLEAVVSGEHELRRFFL